jgi:hypothetical protein
VARVAYEEPIVAESRAVDATNMIGRFVAVVASAVPTIISLIALVQFDWSATGFDSPAVTVAGMAFRPWLAIGTLILGLVAMAAAASWDRESKLFIGAVFVAIGIVLLIATPTVEDVVLSNRMAWMFLLVGVVIALVGLLTGRTWASRRTVYS